MNRTAVLFVRAAAARLEADYLPKIIRCVAALPPDRLWWRPNAATNSVGNLLLHLEGNLRQWVVVGLGGGVDRRRRADEFAAEHESDASPLIERLQATVEEAARVLRSLDEDALTQRLEIQVYWTTGLHAALHAVEHFSGHTGQIIWITKMLTGASTDFYRL